MRTTHSIRIALAALALVLGAAAAPPPVLADTPPAAQPAASPAPAAAIVPGNEDATTTKLTKQVMDGLRAGKLDRSILADVLNKTITEPMLAQAHGAFAPGAPPQWTYLGYYPQAGETPRYVYRVRFTDFAVIVQSHLDKDSKVDLYAVAPDKSQ